MEILKKIHGEKAADEKLFRIRERLCELYGTETGKARFRYLKEALIRFLDARSDDQIERDRLSDPEDPYAHLAGRVFAIAYPDNVYEESCPTLETLDKVLQNEFPDINGIHILPERPMSHEDVCPQDFFTFMHPEGAVNLLSALYGRGILDSAGYLTESYSRTDQAELEAFLRTWAVDNHFQLLCKIDEFPAKAVLPLRSAFDSHFNDGGFSQTTRKIVDPRFGSNASIARLTERYAVMLDYVVNHLDVDNPILEAYRRHENDGEAFIIIDETRYAALVASGDIKRTFRPRPYPLFTGMRKYPAPAFSSDAARIDALNSCFKDAGLKELDPRIIRFFAIAFKIQNDQGLNAGDRRVMQAFLSWLGQMGVPAERIFAPSAVQPKQSVFRAEETDPGAGPRNLAALLKLDPRYAHVFSDNETEIFGERFYVYTTFSESQADINPVSEAGFRLIFDDLFALLSAGDLAMLRMDAIKYLWKEIGKSNFDMEEGNRLIEVVRLVLSLAAPRAIPLDEVNSPDAVVYRMGGEGGFIYLFGQVNAVSTAFNEASLKPVDRLYALNRAMRPENLVLFVMLSTHDGRSVQGIGVQRGDGHVSIAEFYRLMRIVEERGGKPKFRSVAPGRIAVDTLEKVIAEAGLSNGIRTLFRREGDEAILTETFRTRENFLQALADKEGSTSDALSDIPAVDFLAQWLIDGITPYELCATSRDSFATHDSDGVELTPEREAARLAAAQLYVLTMEQTVPAIYFNDLLGLGNDQAGYQRSGKPRDLNRRKSSIAGLELGNSHDPFFSHYHHLINRIIKARVEDKAFYPGAKEFEYRNIENSVFLNHPYSRGNHSLILGNITNREKNLSIDLKMLKDMDEKTCRGVRETGFTDRISGRHFFPTHAGELRLTLAGWGILWLSISCGEA